MLTIILIFSITFFYLLAGGLQLAVLSKKIAVPMHFILLAAFLGIVIHALLLYRWIDLATGQNLTFFNALSQVAWFIVVLLVIVSLVKPTASLGVFIYPFAIVTIWLAWLFPGERIINTVANPKQLVHILLAFLLLSVFFIVCIQAILLACQDRLLHSRRTGGIVRLLPPLDTMESLLFQMIGFGFGLLSIVLMTSLFFIPNVVAPEILRHAILAVLAWIVFAVLLFGRKRFGWRGRSAIHWTLSGFILLLLCYWIVSFIG